MTVETLPSYTETLPDEIDTLFQRVESLIHPPTEEAQEGALPSWLELGKIADSRVAVTAGLETESQSYKTLLLINSFTQVADSQPYEPADVLNQRARRSLAETVWNNSDAIIRLTQDDDAGTATLAQVVLFKALCEPSPYPSGEDVNNQLLDALRQTLPSAVIASQRDDSRSVQDTQLETLTSRLLTTGHLDRTTGALHAIEQIVAVTPVAADISRIMTEHASKLIDGTPPDSVEEFAYKIHAAQLLDRLKEPYRDNPWALDDLISSIVELDATGKEKGWDKALWDTVANFVLEKGGAQYDGKITAMLLREYGLSYGNLREAWATGSGFKRTEARFDKRCDENLKRIIDLERACPGAARKLNAAPCRIRNFARVPLDALVAQYTAITQGVDRYAPVGLGIYENPQAPDEWRPGAHSPEAEAPLWENLHESASELGIVLLFHEGDGRQLASALATGPRRYGQPAEFGVGKWHNGPESGVAHIGEGLGPRHLSNQAEIAQLSQGVLLGNDRLDTHLRRAIKKGGELVLIACGAGAPGNTAQTLQQVIGNTVAGPEVPTNGFVENKVRVAPNPDGGHQLIFRYRSAEGDRVATRRYS